MTHGAPPTSPGAAPADPVAAELVAALRAQLPDRGFRLDGFEVQLGAVVDLDPDELRAALQRLVPGVEVLVTPVPAVLHCDDCGAEYPADEHPCPVCGSNRAHLVHGQELGITRAWGETVAENTAPRIA